MAKEHLGNPERVLGVKLKTYPAPSRKRGTLAYVCFDAGPRGTVAVRVAASDSPSWAPAPRRAGALRSCEVFFQMT